MIHFAISEPSLPIGIGRYLGNRGVSLKDKLTPHTYETLFLRESVPTGTWIFSAIDTLTPAGRAVASQLRTRLVDAGCRVLNDPARSLRRFDLLAALHDAGINQFRAVRAADYRGGMRFPLFLRHDGLHDGSISPLLHSDAELRRELFSVRLRGHSLDDLLVVEFRDLSIDGVFRKYSAFRVGDKILGRHAQSSSAWMIKSDTGQRSTIAAEEERMYVDSNPHEALLAPLFELANIEYGRMDYGYRDGRVEVWEINTAPTLGRPPHTKPDRPEDSAYRAIMEPTLVAFHRRFCDTLASLDSGAPSADISANLHGPTLDTWRHESERRRRRDRVVAGLRTVSQLPGFHYAWRSMESATRRLLGASSRR